MVMKALTVFLAIYIVLLSGLPCPDVAFHSASPKIELTRDTSAGDQGDQDHCSPFCTCQCCQACFQLPDMRFEFAVLGAGFAVHAIRTDYKNLVLFDFFIPPKA